MKRAAGNQSGPAPQRAPRGSDSASNRLAQQAARDRQPTRTCAFCKRGLRLLANPVEQRDTAAADSGFSQNTSRYVAFATG
jgi:hypothetical protein